MTTPAQGQHNPPQQIADTPDPERSHTELTFRTSNVKCRGAVLSTLESMRLRRGGVRFRVGAWRHGRRYSDRSEATHLSNPSRPHQPPLHFAMSLPKPPNSSCNATGSHARIDVHTCASTAVRSEAGVALPGVAPRSDTGCRWGSPSLTTPPPTRPPPLLRRPASAPSTGTRGSDMTSDWLRRLTWTGSSGVDGRSTARRRRASTPCSTPGIRDSAGRKTWDAGLDRLVGFAWLRLVKYDRAMSGW